MLLPGLVIVALYALLLVIFRLAYSRLRRQKPQVDTSQSFSIIIAFRDESLRLDSLCTSLSRLDYPHENWEVIFVDDHSTDGGAEIIRKYHDAFQLKIINAESEGKKAALSQGILSASHPRLLFTDADCWLRPDILQIYSGAPSDDFILGPVKLTGTSSPLTSFQQMDFAMMQMVTACCAALDIVFLANGANLSYPKAFFESEQGFQDTQTPSGDDILFLHQKRKNSTEPSKLYFSMQQQSIVDTPAQETLQDFIQQRIRWGSKAKYYPSGWGQFFTILFFVTNVVMLSYLIAGLWDREFLRSFGILVSIKMLSEWLLLVPALRFFNIKVKLLDMILMQIPHIIYMVGIGIASLLPRYEWKGRRY